MNYKNLIEQAFLAQESSYAPYTDFNVGAALLSSGGNIYKGCNIESASHTPSCCAERTAFFKAISEKERDFKAIAIVGGPASTPKDQYDYLAPCGVCRQVMVEFCDLEDFEVILARSVDDYKTYSLNELLPLSFTGKDLNK